jgi:hypothetical protein
MSTERFIVKKVIKFGMLFGYVVYDTIEKKNSPYEYDEHDFYRAQSRAALMSALSK